MSIGFSVHNRVLVTARCYMSIYFVFQYTVLDNYSAKFLTGPFRKINKNRKLGPL